MSTKTKGFFKTFMSLQAAATVMASILIGRVIGQVARGFGNDDEVIAQAQLYKLIKHTYPDDTIEVAVMFKRMLDNADDGSASLAGLDLTDAEKAEWQATMGVSEKEQLRVAVRPLIDLLDKAEVTSDAWDSLSPLAQYSLIVRTERNLINAVARYSTWTSAEGTRLRVQAEETLPKLSALVSELVESMKDELDQARSNGIKLAERQAA